MKLNFDGSCRPNPGGVARYGYHITYNDGKPFLSGDGTIGEGPIYTNNVAEWYALGFALRALVDSGVRPVDLLIEGDSKLVILQLLGQWRVKDPHLRRCRERCVELLRSLGCSWNAQWVSRDLNEIADRLAS